MDGSQIDAFVQRLVTNPHDEEALVSAHQAGASDPKSYALLLERVGAETVDPAYASHWLSEAANVWSTTLGDAHRAARVLMQAIERDPTQRLAADRLAQLYRDKGDARALVALLERRAKALAPLAQQSDEIRVELAEMHEELARLWGESLQQPKKALDNFRRSLQLDPSNPHAIYGARELHKALGHLGEASEMYEAELAIERDPSRQLALLTDEVSTRRAAGDLAGATRARERARQIDSQDPVLQQQYGELIIERIDAGDEVPVHERTAGAELLVGLAETYDGEHGLAYSAGALDIDPGHDRALQLHAHYARALQREEDLPARYAAYVERNPAGAMAADARWALASNYEGAARIDDAIKMLEPLQAFGDDRATAKVAQLRGAITAPIPSEITDPRVQAGQPSEASPPAVPSPTDDPANVLALAQTLASDGNLAEAYEKFRQVLETDSDHAEALSWCQEYLRTRKDYGALRDLLEASLRGGRGSPETRKERLHELAALCEGNLREVDGAIAAYKDLLAIDRADDGARESLVRLLQDGRRWDDLARWLEEDAAVESDQEKKIALEKKVALLHESDRNDATAAAEAWTRVAKLTPEDDDAVAKAAELFERSGAIERAAKVLREGLASITLPAARGSLLERLATLCEKMGDAGGAARAYEEAAETQKSPTLWASAERCFVSGEQWERAASAAMHIAADAADRKQKAQHFARAASYFGRANDDDKAVSSLERAVDLEPESAEYAGLLSERYTSAEKWVDLVTFLVRRADRLADAAERVAVRRQAARIYGSRLGDKEGARAMWANVLSDGDDKEALEMVIEDAVEREDHAETVAFLRRLAAITEDPADRTRIALREADVIGHRLGDVDGAIACYERILDDIDPTCRRALQAIADLQAARGDPSAAIRALERDLKLVVDKTERGQIGRRLAPLYEEIGDLKSAAGALEMVRDADADDFDALARLSDLCERTEQWEKAAELLAQRIDVEADEAETSALTTRLANILQDRLDRGDEALAVLTQLADMGDSSCRVAYIELGDRLGWQGIVATKLVEWWFESKQSQERTASLRGAFERFAAVGRTEEAIRVGREIVRSKGADHAVVVRLEELSTKAGDIDALAVAQDLLAHDLMGRERARELVRQAEGRQKAGAPRIEALQHGETGLTGISPAESEELLSRLAALADDAGDVIDLYERQIIRCKAPSDRMKAMARAAQVAAERGRPDRARIFFDHALGGTLSDETLSLLEHAAREGDASTGSEELRRALCAALAAGGQGARDGGRTRGDLLRRAASIAHRDLGDSNQAFVWLGDALIAHVEARTLDEVDSLAHAIGNPRRAEETLSRALEEVFDGPLVRQLLARRANLRLEVLADKAGGAADLKKLHELAPSDQGVMDELSALLAGLGDYRGMVQLYEDHILRGKDMASRAELARKVATMWEERLADPREAADAWRRVLRMKPGDPEATAGLERAKSNMLKKSAEADEGTRTSPPPPEPAIAAAPGTTDPPAAPAPVDATEPIASPEESNSVEAASSGSPPDAPPSKPPSASASEPASALASEPATGAASESAAEAAKDGTTDAATEGGTETSGEPALEPAPEQQQAPGLIDFEEEIIVTEDFETTETDRATPAGEPPPEPAVSTKKSDKKRRKRSTPPGAS